MSSLAGKLPDGAAALLRVLVDELRSRTLDESPSTSRLDAVGFARELGYRSGHNDATRSLARELEAHLALACACSCGYQVRKPITSAESFPGACPKCGATSMTVAEVLR